MAATEALVSREATFIPASALLPPAWGLPPLPGPGWLFGPPLGYGYGYGYGGGGISPLFLLLLAGAAYAYFSGGGLSLPGAAGGGAGKIGVARVQVGLLGSARDVQRDLDALARSANTSNLSGLQRLLEGACLALNRADDFWVYGLAEAQSKGSPEAAEAAFGELEMGERRKFKEETLVNLKGQKRGGGAGAEGGAEGLNEYIVVTLLVAADGNLKMPRVNSRKDLQDALTRLGAVPAKEIQAVQIIWAPQDRSDTLSSEDIVAEYSDLRPL